MKNKFSILEFLKTHIDKARNDYAYGEHIFNGFASVVVLFLACVLGVPWAGVVFIVLFSVGILMLGNEKKEYVLTVATLGIVIFTFSLQSKDLDDRLRNYDLQVTRELGALQVQIDTFNFQFRPWVGLDLSEAVSVKSDFDSLKLRIKAKFENVGSLPAKNVNIKYIHEIIGASIDYAEYEPTAVIFPGQKIILDRNLENMKEEIFNGIIDGRNEWKLTIHIQYEGVNTKNYFTEYQLEYDKKHEKFIMLSGDFN